MRTTLPFFPNREDIPGDAKETPSNSIWSDDFWNFYDRKKFGL